MVFLGAVVLPHGAMPFDGDAESASPACRERHAKLDPVLRDNLSALYHGACAAGAAAAALQPTLVLLHTPHGVSLSNSYALYSNNTANGNALWLGEWSEFTASVALDTDVTSELMDHLLESDVAVQGLRSFGGLETKLRWGEVIPFWFLQKYLVNEPKYAILSNDYLPRPEALEPWRLALGASVAQFIRTTSERVLVVISGDLAHYHPTDCTEPLYLPDTTNGPMPVDKEGAEIYEGSIAQWVRSGLPNKAAQEGGEGAGVASYAWSPDAALPYLAAAVSIDGRAGACGTKGFVLLHGLLAAEAQEGASFISTMFVHRVPTYYGMMAATFVKN